MGRPKALLRVNDRPILTYLLQRFPWKGPKWLITAPAKENPPGADEFDRELVDPQAGIGPLRGILTALESLETAFLIVTTVDMPLLEADHLRYLIQRLSENRPAVGLMYELDSTPQPFPLALRKEAFQPVLASLQTGRRSVHGLLAEPRFFTVPVPEEWDDRMWLNLNKPVDFEKLSGS